MIRLYVRPDELVTFFGNHDVARFASEEREFGGEFEAGVRVDADACAGFLSFTTGTRLG